MAIECPAPGCDYSGLVDQVAGHIGGCTDELHDGMVPTRVRGGVDQGGVDHDGGVPTIVLVGVGLVFVLLVVSYFSDDRDEDRAGSAGEPGDLDQHLVEDA